MIQKICPFCRLDSYSAYNDPNWLCPYCGQNIGNARTKEKHSSNKMKLAVLKNRNFKRYPSPGRIRESHLRVVSD